mmetsp:Transcript_9645/g.20977  ORF Transcript_9645/g.20977 Transcript_9645/m.20977 type:complete len:262 (+) Transcript_9645:2422-3207(+)
MPVTLLVLSSCSLLSTSWTDIVKVPFATPKEETSMFSTASATFSFDVVDPVLKATEPTTLAMGVDQPEVVVVIVVVVTLRPFCEETVPMVARTTCTEVHSIVALICTATVVPLDWIEVVVKPFAVASVVGIVMEYRKRVSPCPEVFVGAVNEVIVTMLDETPAKDAAKPSSKDDSTSIVSDSKNCMIRSTFVTTSVMRPEKVVDSCTVVVLVRVVEVVVFVVAVRVIVVSVVVVVTLVVIVIVMVVCVLVWDVVVVSVEEV